MDSTNATNQDLAARWNATGYGCDGLDRGPSFFWRRASISASIPLAAWMLLGDSLPAVAQGVVETCALSSAAMGAIEDSIGEGPGIVSPQASFVVGYSLSGAAPVICANSTEVEIAGPLTETTVVPGRMDILAAEEAFFVRYRPNRDEESEDAARPGFVEKRFCHTVGVEGQTDCFIIFSVIAPDDDGNGNGEPPAEDFGPVRVNISTLLAAEIAAALEGVDEAEIPPFVQSPPGIASQVCQESAAELAHEIRETGTAECDATQTSQAFNNLVEQQLVP
jgi:hypothetical protein